jgi:hypothetical protein
MLLVQGSNKANCGTTHIGSSSIRYGQFLGRRYLRTGSPVLVDVFMQSTMVRVWERDGRSHTTREHQRVRSALILVADRLDTLELACSFNFRVGTIGLNLLVQLVL